MIRIQRILCPVDFSDFSRRALDHAVAIARWYGATITLQHVCPPVPVAAYAPGSGALPSAAPSLAEREALMATMERFAADARASVPIELDLEEGSSSASILAQAAALPADLLVMGTHGRSGFERLVLGSVTERVLRQAECPVLTVPKAVTTAESTAPVLFKEIVCAIDFSACSLRALNYAISLAQEADADLTVVHVIEVPPEIPREVHEPAYSSRRSLREYIALAEEYSRARLQEAIPPNVRASCRVETELPIGTSYREILRIAAERHADLLVIGIHGRGAIDRMFFGSTAQHLVRQATCPVLTLRTG